MLSPEVTQMRFEAEIIREEAALSDVVRELAYGDVSVHAEWPEDLTTPEIRVALDVRGDVDRKDAPAYVEVFFHDVFLLLNLAAPGSFGGTIATTGTGLQVRELTLSPRFFAYAADLERLPLERVMAWYATQTLGTRQIAADGVTTALFQLLHLARREEDETDSILRLAAAAKALSIRTGPMQQLFELRDTIVSGRAPLIHPMHDDALDPRVEDATRAWIEVADAAASAIIRNLQERIPLAG